MFFGPGSIWPESERVYPQGFEAARNALVLRELVERSERKIDLLDGMPNFLNMITEKLRREILDQLR